MRKMKRLLAVLLAAVMVMTMGSMSVMADDEKETYTITINSSLASRTYVAYQLFTGDMASDGSLTNVKTGDGVNVFNDNGEEDEEKIENLTRAMTTSTKAINSEKTGYSTLGALFTGAGAEVGSEETENSSAAVMAKILAEYGNERTEKGDESVLVAFAEEVSSFLLESNAIKDPTPTTTTQGDVTAYSYSFTGLDAGYYLIVDKTTLGSTDDANSRNMLVMTSSEDDNTVTIDSKEEVPTLTKTLSNGEDSASISIGDEVTYKLTTTIPDTTGYSSYTYKITDKLSCGLELVEGTEGTAAGSGNLSPLKITVKLSTADNNLSGIRLSSEDDAASASGYDYYYYTTTETDDDGKKATTLEVVFTDFLSLAAKAESSDNIVITYVAKLTEDAVIGSSGNKNSANLTYSNNPYNSSTTSSTTKDEVTVYTYQIDFTKVDSANTSNKLSGAKFYLTKVDSDNNTYYATVKSSNNVYTVTGWSTSNVSESNLMVSASDGTFSIVGLGTNATYELYEYEAPSGYEKWGDNEPVAITITVTEDETGGDKQLSATATAASGSSSNAPWTGDWSTGKITATITNSSSSIIPSTGGIGTTIFYIVGAILVLGAGVILITRRRMASR